MRQRFSRYLRANWLIHLTLGCTLLVGISLGVLIVYSLQESTTNDLQIFLNTLLQEQPKTLDIGFSQQLLRDNLIMMLLIWVFGITVVGIPLIYLIIVIRGAVFGFSVCFFFMSQGWTGVGFVLVSILLPSVLFFICLLLASGLATRFSFHMLRSRTSGKPLRGYFSQYSLMFLLATLGLVGSGFLQWLCTTIGVSLFGY